MPASPNATARDEVLAAHRAHLRSMADGDTDALDDLLDHGFTRTHITGYLAYNNSEPTE
ncbi:hypothetical protein ACGFY7_09040 [Streptomyces prunicolor]|uniref:hypothetical protein n=1 Tax=Streptomyces prunicolor TaxID=67348 RepID=UPI003721951C